MKALALAAMLSAPAFGQSTIIGVDVRQGNVFTTNTANFVADYAVLAPVDPLHQGLYALDFDATATTLYAINDATRAIVTIDTVSGITIPTGAVATVVNATGLAADPNGVDWWVSEFDGANSNLYRGDITSGAFTFVGAIAPTLIIDIALSSTGELYGLSVLDNSLYSIDRANGAGTVIGPTSLNLAYAQGMDFDWSDDTLYAAIYTGDGTGKFCSVNLTTGRVDELDNTFDLNAELEMAVQEPANGQVIGASYCNSTVPNSSGATGNIIGQGSIFVNDNDLSLVASGLPANQFGIFLASRTQGFTPGPTASTNGNLCLSGTIGRFFEPNQILSAGPAGRFSLDVDLNQVPEGSVLAQVQSGETWNFQAWFRDSTGQGSNFTNGTSINFQ